MNYNEQKLFAIAKFFLNNQGYNELFISVVIFTRYPIYDWLFDASNSRILAVRFYIQSR